MPMLGISILRNISHSYRCSISIRKLSYARYHSTSIGTCNDLSNLSRLLKCGVFLMDNGKINGSDLI